MGIASAPQERVGSVTSMIRSVLAQCIQSLSCVLEHVRAVGIESARLCEGRETVDDLLKQGALVVAQWRVGGELDAKLADEFGAVGLVGNESSMDVDATLVPHAGSVVIASGFCDRSESLVGDRHVALVELGVEARHERLRVAAAIDEPAAAI